MLDLKTIGNWGKGGTHVIMPSLLDCDIIANELELYLHYYIHFRTNTLVKNMKSGFPSYWFKQVVPELIFYKDGFGIKNPQNLIYH